MHEDVFHAAGGTGRLARAVRLVELDDHLVQGAQSPGPPPYSSSRRRIAAAPARQLEVERAAI